jgi:hypothetical protein
VIIVGGCYLLAHGNDYLVTLLSSPGRTS